AWLHPRHRLADRDCVRDAAGISGDEPGSPESVSILTKARARWKAADDLRTRVIDRVAGGRSAAGKESVAAAKHPSRFSPGSPLDDADRSAQDEVSQSFKHREFLPGSRSPCGGAARRP